MTDELDPVLTRLFAQAREPLADGEFTAALLLKIERARRTRLWVRIAAIAAAVIFAALNVRPVLETTAAAVRLVGELSPASTELFMSPWEWAASMLIGAGLLLRFRPSRR